MVGVYAKMERSVMAQTDAAFDCPLELLVSLFEHNDTDMLLL